jgi:hypothetical protein
MSPNGLNLHFVAWRPEIGDDGAEASAAAIMAATSVRSVALARRNCSRVDEDDQASGERAYEMSRRPMIARAAYYRQPRGSASND